jgi:hypothetical protein
MNCFNIRELQGILKRKFFTDLVNTNDFRGLANQTLIGARYKQNSNINNMSDMSILYNYGTTVSSKSKVYNFQNLYSKTLESSLYTFFNSVISINFSGILRGTSCSIKDNLTFLVEFFKAFLFSFYNFVFLTNFDNYTLMVSNFFRTLSLNLNIIDVVSTKFYSLNLNVKGKEASSVIYESENINVGGSKTLESQKFAELSNNLRFVRFYNPIISYDYKTGNYIGQWESMYPSLITSYIEVARNIRKAAWVFSDQYEEFLKKIMNNFNVRFTTQMNLQLADVDN